MRSGDDAVDRKGVVEGEASVWPAAAQVDAELLEDPAMDLGDGDTQADLVGATNRQR